MANNLKRITGEASTIGATILTVPASTTITIIGMRVANKDPINDRTFHITVNGTLVTGIDTPLPAGSALEALDSSKIVAEAGDVISATADANVAVDVYISYLEQTA